MTQNESTQVMQPTVEIETSVTTDQSFVLKVSVETSAYLILMVFAALLRLLQLGHVPLTFEEVPRVLAAWQMVQPHLEPTVSADSPLLQLAHMASFSMLGGNEFAARVSTALVGVLLIFSPLLFKDLLGRTRTFVMCLLLSASPILLASTRLDSPLIWESAAIVLSLWLVWQYWQNKQSRYATATIVLLMVSTFLTGPTGYMWCLILLVTFSFAERLYTPIHSDDEPDMMETVRSWSWLPGLGIGTLIIVVLSTGFMVYPQGLNAIAQSLGTGINGWIRPVDAAPLFFGFLSSLVYEWIFWIFALIGIVLILRRDEQRFTDVFFVTWLIVGALASILYAGTSAAHALWITIPLIGVASAAIENVLGDDVGFLWYDDDDHVSNVFGLSVPKWARWVIAGIAACLLSLVFLHLGVFSRLLQITIFNTGTEAVMTRLAPSGLILLVLLTLLLFVGFTSASLYGARTTLRGGAVGLFVVGWFAALGGGWLISFSRAGNPVDLWYAVQANSEESTILRETLLALSDRETGGFPQLEVVVVVDDENITTDGIIPWVLRDFENATYVNSYADARTMPVILAPVTEELPNLDGNYVGQTFVMSRKWYLQSLSWQEIPAWLYQRATNDNPIIRQDVVLWLRQDIYDGTQP